MHIPEDADEIPEEFLEEAENCDMIICTGDLEGDAVLDDLLERADVRVVKGENDYVDLPEQDLVTIEGMKFGVVHGHQIEDMIDGGNQADVEEDVDDRGHPEKLMEFADLLKADILVTGHTHKPFRTDKGGTVLLNPGSATGVDSEKKSCMVAVVEGTELKSCEILTSEG